MSAMVISPGLTAGVGRTRIGSFGVTNDEKQIWRVYKSIANIRSKLEWDVHLVGERHSADRLLGRRFSDVVRAYENLHQSDRSEAV